ncbi:MAG: hypothetical protein H6766_06920 [Candidatus Peribacteria bacterium]|nr:MAG: hypothetical protein H6766_06920 [Candidatus Peribacteria bacterium]
MEVAQKVEKVEEIKKEEEVEKVEKKPVEVVADVADYDAVKTALLDHLESPTLKGLVEKYVMIDSIDGGMIQLIAINKIAEINLNKEETKHDIEKIFSDIVGHGVTYAVETMTKEEYAARLLG